MRRKLVATAVLALPLLTLAGPAEAAPGGGATITRGEESGIYCAELEFGYAVTTDFVDISGPGGVETLICQFTGIDYPTPTSLRSAGFPCGTAFGFTTDSSFVITPSGEGTLVCRVKSA